MKLTKQKLSKLITEALEQEKEDTLLAMFQSGDEGDAKYAIELLDMMASDDQRVAAAEVLLRTLDNEKFNRLGLDWFMEVTGMPEPESLEQMGGWIQLDYPPAVGKVAVDLLKERGWKEGRGFQTDDFWYMTHRGTMMILIPIRQTRWHPTDDSL